MDFHASNLNSLWASHFIEELVRLGCDTFCIAPGSRSTPLTVAAARHPQVKTVICYDERSAAFFALGYARAEHKPAAVIVTSGTAVANLLPAVVEASVDRVPMVILTADRPPELRGVGANQAIDQVKIFGNYVRASVDVPPPDDRVLVRALLGMVDQTYLQATHPLGGPVHFNCMFREPLDPNFVEDFDRQCLAGLDHWRESQTPLTQYVHGHDQLSISQFKSLADVFQRSETGVIVAGSLRCESDQQAILRLARQLEWPIFADVTSGIRFLNDPMVIHGVDHLLLHPHFSDQCHDVVLQFGGRLTSKRLQQFLDRRQGKRHIFIDNHCMRQDPGFSVSDHIHVDVAWFCESVLPHVEATCSSRLLPVWRDASAQMCEIFDASFRDRPEVSEPYVARAISRRLSDRALFLSSSMPIRDMDMFAAAGRAIPKMAANRGASGIDGVISTACGFAYGSSKPTTLLIGDLAFLHDANGLSLLSKVPVPIIVVVINNQGGGIFSFLPIAKSSDVFGPFFDTPHDHNLEGLSHVFNIKHVKVSSTTQFDQAYQSAIEDGNHCVIEVQSETKSNWEFHERIKTAVVAFLNDRFPSSSSHS